MAIAGGVGAPDSFRRRGEELERPDTLQAEWLPLLTAMQSVNEQLATLAQTSATMAQDDAVVQRLRTAPGVGPLTVLAFVATLDEVERFDKAHHVESSLGLVPREWSSGEQQRGTMTKQGSGRLRALVVGAAWRILRHKGAAGGKRRRWAERRAARRGKWVAVVALARRLAGMLYALWRDGSVDEEGRVGHTPRAVTVAA
jgi:transposase